jgi:hypothetical protein
MTGAALFFIVAYQIANLMILMARYCLAMRLRSTARRLAEELREGRQPSEPDMRMIVKNAEGAVIYSAPV